MEETSSMTNYLEAIIQLYKEILKFCAAQKEILGLIAIACLFFSVFGIIKNRRRGVLDFRK